MRLTVVESGAMADVVAEAWSIMELGELSRDLEFELVDLYSADP